MIESFSDSNHEIKQHLYSNREADKATSVCFFRHVTNEFCTSVSLKCIITSLSTCSKSEEDMNRQ